MDILMHFCIQNDHDDNNNSNCEEETTSTPAATTSKNDQDGNSADLSPLSTPKLEEEYSLQGLGLFVGGHK